MRKVIPYIASGYRKDKIWLRRTKLSKRDYKIMLMIDNSLSMSKVSNIALSTISLLTNALMRLEDINNEIAIVSFSNHTSLLHPFNKPFTDDCGAFILSQFTFNEQQTLLNQSLNDVRALFKQQESKKSNTNNNNIPLQLCFVVSDAKIDSENREKLMNTIHQLQQDNILLVLILLDNHNNNQNESIFNTKVVSFENKVLPNGGIVNEIKSKNYFDDFPFPYYIAIQQIELLPDILSDALKQ
eukprot:gene17461-24155_t